MELLHITFTDVMLSDIFCKFQYLPLHRVFLALLDVAHWAIKENRSAHPSHLIVGHNC